MWAGAAEMLESVRRLCPAEGYGNASGEMFEWEAGTEKWNHSDFEGDQSAGENRNAGKWNNEIEVSVGVTHYGSFKMV